MPHIDGSGAKYDAVGVFGGEGLSDRGREGEELLEASLAIRAGGAYDGMGRVLAGISVGKGLHMVVSGKGLLAGGVFGGERLSDGGDECWDEGGVESSTLEDRGGDGLFEEFPLNCVSVSGLRRGLRGGRTVL